ncbi:hypothetical protein FDUTEX481_06399 [Tolypothrix sp. PCC 7601]|nr:hypothetical protein FDUTEX481_06399 [Tolypothrix sp. PCC 7601]
MEHDGRKLCFNWYLGEGKLPETKAGLYEQFVGDSGYLHLQTNPPKAPNGLFPITA